MTEDNPPTICPFCGSTDQEYIYAGEWICGDCNERWHDLKNRETLVTCPKCSSTDLRGSGRGHCQKLEGQGGEPIYLWERVRFTCDTCGHWWTDKN